MLVRGRCPIVGVLIAAQILTSCTSWQVVQVSPLALVDSAHASAILVQETGGAKSVFRAPRVTGDSLAGTVKRAPRQVPLAAVERMAVRKPDAGRTTVLGVGIVLFGLGAAVALHAIVGYIR